ncbi:helix-turn-helix domain-containing protein [Streptomyces sp. KMM 9044]|uniref:helix-turn-helix domain-containing protein n=1 Tax=Streptomyces sp. KMM 9044 TaxID=2744474 RepID=UPI003FA68DFA
MSRVWGSNWGHRTIGTLVSSLRTKLGSSGWIITVRGVGCRMGHAWRMPETFAGRANGRREGPGERTTTLPGALAVTPPPSSHRSSGWCASPVSPTARRAHQADAGFEVSSARRGSRRASSARAASVLMPVPVKSRAVPAGSSRSRTRRRIAPVVTSYGS